MDLVSIKKIETAEQYEAVCARVDELISEASKKGMLESEYDNEYTREIGRLSRLGAMYENEYMAFEYLKVGAKVIGDVGFSKASYRVSAPLLKTKRKVFA